MGRINLRRYLMKTFIKITAVVMAMLICCAAFVSCGGGDTKSSDANGGDAGNAASVSGKTQTWGNITVLVPDDMNFKGGSMLDEKDPNVVNISKKDNATNYFLITINDDEEGVKSGVESTKKMNKGSEDVTFEAGTKWTGVSYDYSGTPAFQVYGKVDGKYVVIQSFGFKTDDDVTTSVLGSLKVKDAE